MTRLAERYHTAAEGAGPVHALDSALRKPLQPHFPSVEEYQLADYYGLAAGRSRGKA